MRHLTITLLLCGMLAGGAGAQEAAAPATEDWEALRTRASELRLQAKQMRSEAQATYDTTARACWEKFLVSGCQSDAKDAQRKVDRAAREVDMEALQLERRVAAHDRELKLEKKRERQQKREAKAAQKAEKMRLEDERRLAQEAPGSK